MTKDLQRHAAGSEDRVKKRMSLREGLHVMMQCHMRQHVADRYWQHEHPGGHASWREPTVEPTTYFVRGLVCRWNTKKMQSESSDQVRTTIGCSQTVGEPNEPWRAAFEEYAKEVGEKFYES